MSEPLTFVTFRWQPPVGYRSQYAPETVYALREMLRRHYAQPHRFVCVTDRPDELPGIETIQIWDDYAGLRSPWGTSYPSCYRRLKLFASEASETFGPRLVCLDLDMVVVSDLVPLFDRPEDFVIWGESDFPGTQAYNGSLWMLRTGTRTQVWTSFGPEGPAKAAKAGSRGSDQGWMNYILGTGEAKWTRRDGVYSFRKHIAPAGNVLPANARVVAFHGKHDPWSYRSQQIGWIKQHYPTGAVAC
jgi:hypothetical protein